jgi:four helix bundle protein
MQNEKDLKDRTKKFALRILAMYSALPKSTEARVLGKQVLRSGTSVGANYREASRGRSKAEFVAKMGDCLKELDETTYWLELLVEGGILPERNLADLLQESRELTAIFVTIIKNTKNNLGNQ